MNKAVPFGMRIGIGGTGEFGGIGINLRRPGWGVEGVRKAK